MKRYLIWKTNFDTRAIIMNLTIEKSWPVQTKQLWEQNKSKVKDGLLEQYGVRDHKAKLKNFQESGVIDVHHSLSLQPVLFAN